MDQDMLMMRNQELTTKGRKDNNRKNQAADDEGSVGHLAMFYLVPMYFMKGDTGKSDTKAWRLVRNLKQWTQPGETSQGTWMGSRE
jgi:hypothetical protein